MLKLKRLFLSFVICYLLSAICYRSGTRAQENPEKEYTLKEAIKSALRNNALVLSQQQEISIAEQQIREATAMFFPFLDFGVSYTFLNIRKPLVLPLSLGGATLDIGSERYYVGRFNLYQSIYTGGRLRAAKKQAEINLTKAKSEYNQAKNDLIAGVKEKFYLVLLNQQLSEFLQGEREQARAVQLKEADLARQQIWLNQLTARLYQLTKSLQCAQLEFNRIIGIELSTAVKVKGELDFTPQEIELNKSLAWGSQYRPELSRAAAEQEVDLLALHLALMRRYPSLSLGGSYERSGKYFPWNIKQWTEGMGENWAVTLALSMPIFEGGASRARVRQQRARLDRARYERARVATQIQEEVRRAHLEYVNESKLKELLEKNLRLAEERLPKITGSYKEGKSSFLEFLDAEEVFIQTKMDYLTSTYRCLVAEAEMERATGKTNEE